MGIVAHRIDLKVTDEKISRRYGVSMAVSHKAHILIGGKDTGIAYMTVYPTGRNINSAHYLALMRGEYQTVIE